MIVGLGSSAAAATSCTDDDEYKSAYYAWRTDHPEASAGKSGGAGGKAPPQAHDVDAGAAEDAGPANNR